MDNDGFIPGLIIASLIWFFILMVFTEIFTNLERKRFIQNGLGYYQINEMTGEKTFFYQVNTNFPNKK